jgi:hypothetical protein
MCIYWYNNAFTMGQYHTIMSQHAVIYDQVISILPQKVETAQAFKMPYEFIQAQLRKQILNLLSLWENPSFPITGKIMIIQGRKKYKTLLYLLVYNDLNLLLP